MSKENPSDKELAAEMMRFLQELHNAEVAQNNEPEDTAWPTRDSQEDLADDLAHRFPGRVFCVLDYGGSYSVCRSAKTKQKTPGFSVVAQLWVNKKR